MSDGIQLSSRTQWDFTSNAMADLIEQYKREDVSYLDLSVSNPTKCAFSFYTEGLLSALSNTQSLAYAPDSAGLDIARDAVVKYYAENEKNVSREDIVLTSSTSEAYSYIFKLLLNPFEEILFPQPSYPLFQFLGDINDVTMTPYNLVYTRGGWHIDFESLQASITDQTRAILLVNPNNPTSSYVKKEELGRLNAICRKHKLSIISDEVFNDYCVDGQAKTSLIGNDLVATFVLSGISKVLALPQMKLSWIAMSGCDGDVFKRLEMIADTYLSVGAPVQYALPVWLDKREVIQSEINERIKDNLTCVREAAENNVFELLAVEGGWSAVLKFPDLDDNFSYDLLKHFKVYIHPGYFYDFGESNYCVISLLAPTETLTQGLNQLLKFLKK